MLAFEERQLYLSVIYCDFSEMWLPASASKYIADARWLWVDFKLMNGLNFGPKFWGTGYCCWTALEEV